jgi:hypothetical protein
MREGSLETKGGGDDMRIIFGTSRLRVFGRGI